MKNKNWLEELIEFYDFLWQHAMESCTYHVNKELLQDFASGGDRYERMKVKIVESFPTEEEARRDFQSFLKGRKIGTLAPTEKETP